MSSKANGKLGGQESFFITCTSWIRACRLNMQPDELAHAARFGNHCSESWVQDGSKSKNLSLKKEELIYDAKTKRLRVICSRPDGRTG